MMPWTSVVKKVQQILIFTKMNKCFSCCAVREMRFQLWSYTASLKMDWN